MVGVVLSTTFAVILQLKIFGMKIFIAEARSNISVVHIGELLVEVLS